MSELENTKQVGRRTVLKGAAWSVPVVAAAAAMPLAGAANSNPNPPECPQCLKPGLGAFELAGLAASGRATLALASAVVLDATGCGSLIGNIFDFQPAFTYVILKAQLTMSNGSVYDADLNGVGIGAGVLGLVGAFPAAFVWDDVRVSGDHYFGAVPQYKPTKLTVTINTTYKWGLGAQKICPNTLVWDLSSALGVGVIANGAGAVTYTGISH
nr:hypothetical protein [Actinomycetota bacterium]